ncbi:MAG: substrate-binding domain-containing protein [Cardiobacteriaceae bacterium]|nr:substrate-binding domain-containing protein [Cardiobacteriaceae bacterium]
MKILKKTVICAFLTAAFASYTQAQEEVVIGLSGCCAKGAISTMDAAVEKFTQRASEAGVKLLYESAIETETDDRNLQVKQVKKMIDEGAKAIIIILVQGQDTAKPQEEIVKYANSKQVPVIAYTRPPNAKLLRKYKNLYAVNSISKEAGIFQGRMIVELWKKHPEWDKNKDGVIQYALIKGPNGNTNAENRSRYVIETINKYPGAQLQAEEVALEVADWNRGRAKNITSRWITGGLIENAEVLIGNSDDIALGALDAFKEAGEKPLPIVGINALPEALKAIENGEMAGTVLQNLDEQVRLSWTIAENLARGKKADAGLEEVKFMGNTVNVKYENITKENLSKYLK